LWEEIAMKPIVAGDKVKLVGSDELYVVVEWNEDRGFVSPVEWEWPIVPQELVHLEHVTEVRNG